MKLEIPSLRGGREDVRGLLEDANTSNLLQHFLLMSKYVRKYLGGYEQGRVTILGRFWDPLRSCEGNISDQ